MGWLAKLSFGKGGAALAEAEREDADSAPNPPSGPQLMVLVNDASGRASFKTHVFDDAEAATEWVRYWFPHEAEDGMTAFWAMTEEPEGARDSGAEPLVMISDTSRDGVVYLFSFVDIDSAQEFLRDEVERGTKPDTMFLYWAVQVKREVDRWGKLILTPSTPPGVAAYDPEAKAFENDGWVVQEAPAVDIASEQIVGDSRALLHEAPNARTGVTKLDDPGNETFELTSWMERARKSSSRKRDVVEIAAEVVAASEESFEEPFSVTEGPEAVLEKVELVEAAVEAEPEPVFEDARVVDDVTEEQPEAVFDDAVVVEEVPAPVFEDAVVVEDVIEEEPEPVFENARVVEDVTEEQPEAVFDDAVVVEASEDAEIQALTEADPQTGSAEVDDRAVRVRASTNGNGHKSPNAHEVVVEINGHKSEHQMPAEPIDNGSMGDELPPSMNGNGAANGHAAQVTSPHGEGTPASEPLGRGNSEASDAVDQAPTIVHEVRVDAATNGKDETISIQIGIHLQSRALRQKRWEVKDEPFEGFKSPPGRF